MKRTIANIRFLVLFVIVTIFPARTSTAVNIGVIMSGDIKYYQDIHKAFIDHFSGSPEAENAHIVLQKPMPNTMSWINASRKLATLGSDLIVSYGLPVTLTALKETRGIPIIFAGVYEPRKMNIAGKNATGISSSVSIETIINILTGMSKIKKLGVPFNKSEKDSILQVLRIKELEKAFGYEAVLFNVDNKPAVSNIKNIDALFITSSSVCMGAVSDIVKAARRDKIPTAAIIGGGEDRGVVITYMASPEEQGRSAAGLVRRIISGIRPSEVPFKRAQEFKLLINLKEANTIGLNIPEDVKSSAAAIIR